MRVEDEIEFENRKFGMRSGQWEVGGEKWKRELEAGSRSVKNNAKGSGTSRRGAGVEVTVRCRSLRRSGNGKGKLEES
jgi:hypothetical protein